MADAPLWKLKPFLKAAGGRLSGKASDAITGLSIDSRTVEPGEAFFAIRGEYRDGHEFAAAALEKGAGLAVVAKRRAREINAKPLLAVADPLHALEDVGKAARKRTRAAVIAITGSVGKTGTKEALRVALSASGAVHASRASYNNQWGVPLSLGLMPKRCDYGVFEIGMNHAGEITPLSKLVRPHIAIVTTVAPVHLGYFNSVDEIAAAKAEIFAGLKKGGTAILNRDNEYFAYLAGEAEKRGAQIVSFGEHGQADARLDKVALLEDCSTVTATIQGTKVTYKIGAPGRHLVLNSLAVLAAVHAAGGDLAKGAMALASWTAPAGRGSRHVFATPMGAVTLVDESYNANPASMRAAIATLGQARPQGAGRRIAVLGDMLELGGEADALHAGLAAPLVDAGVDLVYTAGPHMAALHEALPGELRGGHAADSAGLAPLIVKAVRGGDVVMVKGSYGSRMAPLVEALTRHLGTRGAA